MAKQILFDNDGREKLSTGVSTLARAVQATLGPSGKNVILDKSFSGPVTTKDGVSVSKEIELPDPFENMGAKILNEVATKTNDSVGDGTTTAIVLARRMIEEGRKYIAAGVLPADLRRGMEKALDKAIDAILDQAIPVKNYDAVRNIALISSNHDEQLGKLLAEGMESVTRDGVITIEENKGTETYLDVVQGLQFDKGFISPYFITDTKSLSVEYENPLIFFFEKKLSSAQELIPVLEKVAMAGRPLVICAEDVEGDALAALVVNKLQGVLKVVAVKSPGFGDRRKNLLEDMAILTGGQFISADLGESLENLDVSSFGSAKKVIVTKDKTTVIEGAGKKKSVEARIEQINAQMEQTTSTYDKEKLTERKAKLGGGIAVLYVGGHTEAEMKERKDRATDALHATRAAVEEGIIPGGGTALVRALDKLEDLRLRGDEEFGAEVVRCALEEPLRRIAENAGLEGGEILAEVSERSGRVGFDARTREYKDMVKAGIVDPCKVATTALENAVSVAGLNLTVNALITDLDDDLGASRGALH